MNHRIFKYSLIASALTLPMAINAADLTEQYNKEQRFIVTFKQTGLEKASGNQNLLHATPSQLSLFEETAQSVDAKIVQHMPNVNAMAVILSPEQKLRLLNNNSVASVEVDPKRFLYAESTPYGVTMVQAPQLSDSGTVNQKVCIMDTGYTLNHPDLPSSGITGDDGYGSNDTGNWYNDGNGHGTHVAGTIAAIGGNGQGVVGVNPSGKLGLHIVKVFNDQGSWAYGSDLIQAVSQCRAAGATVISMSLGGGGSSSAEQAAFDQAYAAGILNVAAAGNDGDSSMSYPASYNSVMSVAAVDSSGNKASFSQYNAQVEIAAPGVGVNSTYNNGGYKSLSGTSMATPHVSGVAALVWANNPKCTVKQLRDGLNATAEDRGQAGRDNSYGHGIVKAKAAHDHLQSVCGDTPPPNQAPDAGFTEQHNGLTVSFSDSSTDDKAVTSHSWTFGDGGTSSTKNPTHTYTTAGSYQVKLTVSDQEGLTDSITKQINVSDANNGNCAAPWSSSVSYVVGDKVTYNGYEYKSIWWSTGAQPDIYSNVWERLDQCDGSNENDAPVASFSFSANKLNVAFSNTSTDDKAVTSSAWNFGDGVTSTQHSPSHTYSAAGTYTVSLTAYDAEGLSNTSYQYVTVTTGDNAGCGGLDAWSASTTYAFGDEVSHNGNKYKAIWWSMGADPEIYSNVWNKTGSCQ